MSQNWKIAHNTKVNSGFQAFITISDVTYKGIRIMRRHVENYHDVDSLSWWMGIIPEKGIPTNAELMNPYSRDSGWLSFNTLRECAEYIDL